MIHYHGTPISGDNYNTVKFLRGKHALVSFAAPNHLKIVKEVCSSFVLDNGAYTIWSKGRGEIDYDAYVQWVQEHYRHPGFDWAIIPDRIGGTDQQNDEWVARWDNSIKGVPVWHLHSDIARLKRLADRFEWVAIGGARAYNSTTDLLRRLGQVFDEICDADGYPPCKIHGLAMLNKDIFTEVPFASADSTNVAQNCNTGTRHGYAQRCESWVRALAIAESIELFNSAEKWVKSPQMELYG